MKILICERVIRPIKASMARNKLRTAEYINSGSFLVPLQKFSLEVPTRIRSVPFKVVVADGGRIELRKISGGQRYIPLMVWGLLGLRGFTYLPLLVDKKLKFIVDGFLTPDLVLLMMTLMVCLAHELSMYVSYIVQTDIILAFNYSSQLSQRVAGEFLYREIKP